MLLKNIINLGKFQKEISKGDCATVSIFSVLKVVSYSYVSVEFLVKSLFNDITDFNVKCLSFKIPVFASNFSIKLLNY